MKTRYMRFDIHQRLQHILLTIGFLGCTLTGLPIRYYETSWASAIVKMFGGFDNMYVAHLVMAVVLFVSAIYHLLYLVALIVLKRWSWETMPRWKDVRDVYDNMRYFLGLTDERPKFERYTYKEKFDYWAVFWGIALIGGTGLMLWFPEITAQYTPRWVLQAARVAHSDEAMLAILTIFVWHFYNVHFNPTLFPGSRVWYSGYLDKEEMEREHPLELEHLQKK